jgi:hypothetical protein
MLYVKRLVLMLLLGVAAVSMASSVQAKKKPEKIRWMPLSHEQFQVSAEVGTFLSCAYRLFKPGTSSSFTSEFEKKLRIKATKTKDERLTIQCYANKKLRRLINRDDIVNMLENATADCFEQLSEE